MSRNISFMLLVMTALACTGCPPVYPPSEIEGTWRATDGAVLQMRSTVVWVISTDPISYPQNNPPCTGYSYIWCKARLNIKPDEDPKKIDIVYPKLVDEQGGLAYCGADPQTIGYSYTLTAGNLTQAQAHDLDTDYGLAMLATLQLSGKTRLGIYKIVDANHIQIALADPGDPRPTTFNEAITYTRDSNTYSHQSLGSFCPGS